MNTRYKLILVGALALLILGFAGYKLLHPSLTGGASAAGTTNSSARIAQSTCVGTATTTIVSLQNTDAQDRLVNSVDMFSTGYSATSVWNLLQAGTSSQSVGTTTTNYLINWTIATGTSVTYASAGQVAGNSTSSLNFVISSDTARQWTAGSFLNFVVNSGASTSAMVGNCNIKVNYQAL